MKPIWNVLRNKIIRGMFEIFRFNRAVFSRSAWENMEEQLHEPSHFTRLPHVYELALFFAKRAEITHIVDIGCGLNGESLSIASEFKVIGIGLPEQCSLLRKTLPTAQVASCDFSTTMPDITPDVLEKSVVIVTGVLEKVNNPGPLLAYLAEIGKTAPFLLITTPDRDRHAGWLASYDASRLVHKWNGYDFVTELIAHGFPKNILYGYTVNDNHHWANTELLVLAGAHVCPADVPLKKVAAVIHCYNEMDMLRETVLHLNRQGVDVYLLDNWSNDGTWELARQLQKEGLVAGAQRFPDSPITQFELEKQLLYTEQFALALDADWIIHYDADELRYSPWKDVTLRQAISWVDTLGYNALDFTVIDFRFLEKQYYESGSYERSLTHFEFGRRPGHFLQIKAWKNTSPVSLALSGGHEAQFNGRKIFPLKFLTKHYPLRTIQQAEKKIFQERLPRMQIEKQKKGWHTHYDKYLRAEISAWKPTDLFPWFENHFYTEFLVPRISGIGLKDK